jgi:hypothetical protein
MPHVERERLKVLKLQERFQFESQKMTGYELIFPCGDKSKMTSYESMLKKANELWDDFNIGK